MLQVRKVRLGKVIWSMDGHTAIKIGSEFESTSLLWITYLHKHRISHIRNVWGWWILNKEFCQGSGRTFKLSPIWNCSEPFFVALWSSWVAPSVCGIWHVNDPVRSAWTQITLKSKSAQCPQEDLVQWLLCVTVPTTFHILESIHNSSRKQQGITSEQNAGQCFCQVGQDIAEKWGAVAWVTAWGHW